MSSDGGMMTFGGHLDVLRKIIIRVGIVALIFTCVIFAFKDFTFQILLAPSKWDFITYRHIESICRLIDPGFRFDEFHVDMIATDLSSQFMTHISTSVYLGLLCASPFILFELFRFVSPALLESEKRYSTQIVIIIYLLFVVGVLMSYYILFPISFRFLGTYSVSDQIHSSITLDSYISTFVTLTLLMGLVFQLPVFCFILGRMGLIDADLLKKYRSYAFIIIMIIAAIITPPDLFTLIIVTIPIYGLYELSILVLNKFAKQDIEEDDNNSLNDTSLDISNTNTEL